MPRKAETKQRKVQLQLTPTAANRHHSPIKPRTPSQNLPTSQVAEHPSAQQACTHLECTCQELHRTIRVIVRVLSVNATRCTSQVGRAAPLHRYPQQLKHAPTPPPHREELVVHHGCTVSLRGGAGPEGRGGGWDERIGGRARERGCGGRARVRDER